MTIPKEHWLKWVEEAGWIELSSQMVPTGRQCIYMTRAGSLAIANYDLKGDLLDAGPLIPQPPPIIGLDRGRIQGL